MAFEEFFLDLLKAEKEEDVLDSLKVWGFEKYDDKWKPYGGVSNNIGQIKSQQAEPIGALVEKIVNSIDAVLTRECLVRNIDPTSNVAPKSMVEASELFFNIPDGNLAKLSANQRTQLAESNINIMLTGSKPPDNPSIIIIDDGEGQEPQNFKDTFVSLSKNNKISIHFVQGKFNMGGSGCISFCGDKNFQLIASKRNSNIPGINNNKWGFTLVRRRPPLTNERSSRIEYLAPNGKILELDLDEIPILPDSKQNPYQIPIKCGTIIKLYEYNLPGHTKTMATVDLFRALSNKLWSVVLPIRLNETREYKGHTLRSTLSGMNIRLEEDKGEVLEEGFPVNFSLNVPKVGYLDGQICLFKKGTQTQRWLSASEAIIYTINGQFHGALSNDFFRRTSVNLPWLAKDLLINIDCSKFDALLVEKVFMANRNFLFEVEEKKAIEDALAEFLRKHEGLRAWNENRHQELVKEKLQDEEETKHLFETLVSHNPNLADLLGLGMKIKIPKPGTHVIDEYKGRRFPTFLKLLKGDDEVYTKECPQNSYCRVVLLTDAENDYMTRAYDPGQLIIRPEHMVYSKHLYNGKLDIRFQPDKEYEIGKEFEVKVMLTSPEAAEGYFSVHFKIKIAPPVEPSSKPPRERKPKGTFLSLPEIVPKTKEEWDEDIEINSEDDVVSITKGEYKTTAFINMDNKYYRNYIYSYPKRHEVLKNIYQLSSTVLGMVIEDQIEKGILSRENRRQTLNSLGKILLPLIDTLSEMQEGL